MGHAIPIAASFQATPSSSDGSYRSVHLYSTWATGLTTAKPCAKPGGMKHCRKLSAEIVTPTQRLKVRGGDVAHAPGDLLEAGDHQPLPFLDRLDVARRLHQRFVRAGVEPGDASRQLLDVQGGSIQVVPVDVADLELPAWRRLEA